MKPACRLVDLALQGGGSHGAFTWGVLDRLLEEEWLEIAGISGTSAGAMNAVALAAGLMENGRDGARTTLRRFWEGVARQSPFHHLSAATNPFLEGWMNEGWGQVWQQSWQKTWQEPMRKGAALMGSVLGSQFSPYQLNPLNLNPLRQVLLDTVDFTRVCGCHKTQLFIAATQVRTGALRIFRQHELSPDVVLASACLPLLFQAVEIDGEAYWDGGYAGNPSLLPLIAESEADDLLLVQINPNQRPELPTSASDILERINEVTFNASLIKEMRNIALMKQLIADEGRPGHQYKNPLFQRVDALRVHRVDGDLVLAPLGAGTKMQTDLPFLEKLFSAGRQSASEWLATHGPALGVRSTLDLDAAFGG